MSYRQQQFVHALPKGSCAPSERSLLNHLAWFADDDGQNIFPSHERLAAMQGASLRWVRMLLRKLERRGWLVPVRRGGRNRYERSAYELRLPSVIAQQPMLPIDLARPVEKSVEIPTEPPATAEASGRIDRVLREDRSCRLIPFTPRPNSQPAQPLPATTPASILTRDPHSTKDPEQRLRRDPSRVGKSAGGFQSRQPADDGNYAVVLKLAHEVFVTTGLEDPDDLDLVEALKARCAALGIGYSGNLVGRALRAAARARVIVDKRTVTTSLAPAVEMLARAETPEAMGRAIRRLQQQPRRRR